MSETFIRTDVLILPVPASQVDPCLLTKQAQQSQGSPVAALASEPSLSALICEHVAQTYGGSRWRIASAEDLLRDRDGVTTRISRIRPRLSSAAMTTVSLCREVEVTDVSAEIEDWAKAISWRLHHEPVLACQFAAVCHGFAEITASTSWLQMTMAGHADQLDQMLTSMSRLISESSVRSHPAMQQYRGPVQLLLDSTALRRGSLMLMATRHRHHMPAYGPVPHHTVAEALNQLPEAATVLHLGANLLDEAPSIYSRTIPRESARWYSMALSEAFSHLGQLLEEVVFSASDSADQKASS